MTGGAALVVDDRLDTVLRTRRRGPAGMRVQFRQLADAERVAPGTWTTRHGRRWLGSMICSRRSAPPRGQPRKRRPACRYAADPCPPGGALCRPRAARARRDPRRAVERGDLLELVPRLPIQARGFLRHRRDLGPAVRCGSQLGIDDFAALRPISPPADRQPWPNQNRSRTPPASAEVIAFDSPPPAVTAASEGIGAIVRRIEAFRRDRGKPAWTEQRRLAEQPPRRRSASAPAFADRTAATALHPESIDLAIDLLGTVVAADADWAPMLVGHRPFRAAPCTGPAGWAQHSRLAARRPITAGLLLLEGAPAIAGAWQIDAVPVFARAGGFAGYRARAAPPGEASARRRAKPRQRRAPIACARRCMNCARRSTRSRALPR
jgi:hypothetical protein